jgi:peptidoglycan hydrolase-like protein with peptidoglycan-binding domain
VPQHLSRGKVLLNNAAKLRTYDVYSWQPAYTAATLEADSAILRDRIKEALEIMRARAFTVDIGSPEYRALQSAKNTLGTLNAERTDGAV